MAPQNIRAESKSKTELLIIWEPPQSEACNGILMGYHVGYLPADDQQNADGSTTPYNRYTMKTININSQYGEDVVISGLTPDTVYSIVVQAFNSKGSGPFSKPITARTDEGSEYPYEMIVLIISIVQELNLYIFFKKNFNDQSAPTMSPEKPKCRSLTSQSIQLSWDLPPPTGRNGKIQGFKVSYQPAEDWYGKFV